MVDRTLSHYEILAELGAGGMGKVYGARDTKLGREVAIKVLPEAFSADEERLARFEREARVLASLNHPNIATIYGLEESNGVRFLVLELVPGETLAEKIRRSPLPLEEALGWLRQIAAALEAAHDTGVIHRDLKPANIKVTPDGRVKVLDFGLAKTFGSPFVSDRQSESPTVTREGTETGVILGTAAYMSPEQARGKPLDKRTDIWAFGCVFYEVLTGQAAFPGETVSDTIARILEREPDWSVLPKTTPSRIRLLIRRCLKKDPEARIHDIADARLELEETVSEPLEEVHPTPRKSAPAWIVAGVTAGLAIFALWAPWRTGSREQRQVMRSSLNLPAAQNPGQLDDAPVLAVSPDGSRLVYTSSEGGRRQLYSRDLGRDETTPIPGTERGSSPFFSPDGKWIGFVAGGKLKKVQLGLDGAGATVICCDAQDVPTRGADWGPDGKIVFSIRTALMRVQASGGAPEALTSVNPDEGERFHYWPDVLPSGRAVIFAVVTGANYDDSRIVVQSFDTGERRFLLQASYARYVPTGHLVYAQGSTLYAVPFDPDRLELKGTGIPIQRGLEANPLGPGSAHFTSSDTGTLVYLGRSPINRRLVLVDLEGRVETLAAPPRTYHVPRFSPDGRRVAVSAGGIHAYELAEKRLSLVVPSPFEGPSGVVLRPGGYLAWSPDGKSLAVNATAPKETMSLFSIAADGSGAAERLTESPYGFEFPDAWSPDGKRLLFTDGEGNGWGIFELTLADRSSRTVLDPAGSQVQPALSADGLWLAYSSDESGRSEIYITPYLGAAGRQQASTDGGAAPVWSPDGRTLYYWNENRMMAAPIRGSSELNVGTPRVLFEGRYYLGYPKNPRTYDLAPDGQRFVMILPERASTPTEFQIVLNWFEELQRLVPP